ncbi:MAG: TonB-dependent receptor [Rubrivivax sp.]
MDAKYKDDFLVCAGVPCNAPTVRVPAGNRIAGTQRGTAFAELAWRSAGFGEFGAEVRHARALMANDTNTEAAAPYTLLGLRWSHRLPVPALAGGWSAEWLLRVDNALDRRYAGSVIVNESNGRFYETGAPRAVLSPARGALEFASVMTSNATPSQAGTAGRLPAQPFFTSPEQRVALARDRYFEHGERPSGLSMSETVLQSWTRCTCGCAPRPGAVDRVRPDLAPAHPRHRRAQPRHAACGRGAAGAAGTGAGGQRRACC